MEQNLSNQKVKTKKFNLKKAYIYLVILLIGIVIGLIIGMFMSFDDGYMKGYLNCIDAWKNGSLSNYIPRFHN
jgi:Ca2+/H+ antiporter